MMLTAIAAIGMSVAAEPPPFELGYGAGIATASIRDNYSVYNGPEPTFSARIFADDKYAQGMTEIALMPVVLNVSPDGIALVQGYNFAFTIQQTFFVGYRFHINETWSVSPAAGLGANYIIAVSGDSGSGAPYPSMGGQLVVAARVADVFAVEAAAIGTYGLSVPVARGALTLSAVFRID